MKIFWILLIAIVLIWGVIAVSSNGRKSTSTSSQNTPTAEQQTSATKTVEVTEGDFYFKPNQITVNKGDKVTMHFSNVDGDDPHDFVLEGYNLRTGRTGPNGKATLTFVADKAGVFAFYCDLPGHKQKGMVGALVVKQ